jgi:endoglucanase
MKLVALAAAAALAGLFYADPDSNAERQARKYENKGRTADAQLRRKLAGVPQAFWFTSGTPKQVRKDVERTVVRAAKAQAVPILVAYNVRGRDCGGFSAGGARHYRRWVDGFAKASTTGGP